jgi:hypothetical protein
VNEDLERGHHDGRTAGGRFRQAVRALAVAVKYAEAFLAGTDLQLRAIRRWLWRRWRSLDVNGRRLFRKAMMNPSHSSVLLRRHGRFHTPMQPGRDSFGNFSGTGSSSFGW